MFREFAGASAIRLARQEKVLWPSYRPSYSTLVFILPPETALNYRKLMMRDGFNIACSIRLLSNSVDGNDSSTTSIAPCRPLVSWLLVIVELVGTGGVSLREIPQR